MTMFLARLHHTTQSLIIFRPQYVRSFYIPLLVNSKCKLHSIETDTIVMLYGIIPGMEIIIDISKIAVQVQASAIFPAVVEKGQ